MSNKTSCNIKTKPKRRATTTKQKGGRDIKPEEKKEKNRFAIFSSVAYADPKDRQSVLDKFNKKSFKIDSSLSNKNVAVIHNSSTGETVFAIRGTNPKNISDLFTDAGIAVGLSGYTPRKKEMADIMNKTIKKYGKSKLTITGHSMGSKIGSHISKEFQLPLIGFNAGSSLPDFFSKSNPLVKHYTTNKIEGLKTVIDPISVSAYIANKDEQVSVPKKDSSFSHSLEHFIPTEEEIKQEGEGKIKDILVKYGKKALKIYALMVSLAIPITAGMLYYLVNNPDRVWEYIQRQSGTYRGSGCDSTSKIQCPCGSSVLTKNYSKHQESKKHAEYINKKIK